MNWLKKKPDPISDRARALNSEIAALESQIKKLDSKLHRDQSHPRVRSTALPHGDRLAHTPTTVTATATPPPATSREPIFEDLEHRDLKSPGELPNTPEHYNELGVRKYDVTALATRVKQLFRGPTTMNPRLVSYLAAGGIQGLQPLRREKRVARNRLIALAVFLCLILIGIIYMFSRNH
jgi:hypothetical protein